MEGEINEIRISFISFSSFYGARENGISEVIVVVGSCVNSRDAWVEVEGSGPTCGILSQMCECV